MELPKRKFREIVFLLLYSYDASGGEEKELASLIMRELKVTQKAVRLAEEQLQAILPKIVELDQLIEKISCGYALDRIQRVEKNILRLAFFEMSALPKEVVIAEAIRLARKFATKESALFVNALLDKGMEHDSLCGLGAQ